MLYVESTPARPSRRSGAEESLKARRSDIRVAITQKGAKLKFDDFLKSYNLAGHYNLLTNSEDIFEEIFEKLPSKLDDSEDEQLRNITRLFRSLKDELTKLVVDPC